MSLRTRLLLALTALALVPLALFGITAYLSATNSLVKVSQDSLTSLSNLEQANLSSLDKVQQDNLSSLDKVQQDNLSSLDKAQQTNLASMNTVQQGNLSSLDSLQQNNLASLTKVGQDNLASLITVERDGLSAAVGSVNRALTDIETTLTHNVADNANWDDIHTAITAYPPDQSFFKTNFDPANPSSTPNTFNLQLLAVWNSADKNDFTFGPAEQFTKDTRITFATAKDLTAPQSAVVTIGGDLYIVAYGPVQTSDAKDPNGLLVFGRKLGADDLSKIKDLTGYDVGVYQGQNQVAVTAPQTVLPAAADLQAAAQGKNVFNQDNPNVALALSPILDQNAKIVGTIVIWRPRTAIALAQKSIADTLTTAKKNIADTLTTAQKSLTDTMTTAQNSMADTMTTAKNNVTNTMSTVKDNAASTLKTAQGSANDTLSTAQKSANDSLQTAQNSIKTTLVIAFVFGAVLALIVAVLLGRNITQPLFRLSETADKIAAGDFSQRVETPSESELRRLAVAFNTMASKVGQRVADSETEATRLQELDEFRLHLLNSVVQALREPVANVKNHASALNMAMYGSLNEAQKRSIESIDRSVTMQQALLSDLIDFSSAQRKQLRIARERLSVGDIVRQIVKSNEENFKEKSVQISTHVPGDLPPLYADRTRVEQMLNTMLNWSYETTLSGGQVSLSASTAPGIVRISVADTSKGLPPEEASKVFDLFYQPPTNGSSKSGNGQGNPDGGQSLGLAFVKALAEQHGGGISLRVEPGRGNIFTLDLPSTN